jgi:D-alanyl-D-alanine carboxypeptidase (penicillin-binding protein 5/6)
MRNQIMMKFKIHNFTPWLLMLFSTAGLASVNFTPEAPQIAAKAFVLMDYSSGRILAQSNAHKKLPPASLTKMMTSYVVGQELKQGNIHSNDSVTVSKRAWARNFPGSSKMFIEAGKQVSVEELNHGIIVQSGNDACVAMAEYIAGTEDGFVSMMNAWAKQLGMNKTHFINSHGLDTDEHYTTAYDMALLARSLIRDVPEEYAIYGKKSFTYNGIKQYNRNRLLWDSHLSVDGIKTGHTDGAGYSLVTSSLTDKMRLITVVLGAQSEDSRARESKKLLKYGFRYYESIVPYKAGDVFTNPKVWYGNKNTLALGVNQDTPFSVRQGQAHKLKTHYELHEELKAPISQGQVVGQITFQIGKEELAKFPLVALEAVEEGSPFTKAYHYLLLFVSKVFEDD